MTTAVTPARKAAPAATADRCVLCGGGSSKVFLQAKQRTVIECAGCGLRALSPMPTLNDMVDINEETVHPFFSSYLEDAESYRHYFSSKIDDLRGCVPSGRLLDVGCGAGLFLEAARDRGYDATGVDLSPVPAAYARDELALDVSVGSLYQYEAASDAFDAVTIFQTIEHDPQPAALCAELYRILAPGGVLMVTTPAADGFVARVMGKRWFGYRNVEHVSFFTRKSLGSALEQAGFEIEALEVEHGKQLSAKYVLNRLINYYYDHRRFLSNGLSILKPVMFLLGKAPLFEPWAHLYVIARKPARPGDAPDFLRRDS